MCECARIRPPCSVLPADGGQLHFVAKLDRSLSLSAGALELEATIEASLQTVTRAHMLEEANAVIECCPQLMAFLPARQLGILDPQCGVE